MIYRRAVLSVSTALFGGNNFFGGLVGGYVGMSDEVWSLGNNEVDMVLKKIKDNADFLLTKIAKPSYGIVTGKDDILMFDLDASIDIEDEMILPVIRAQGCCRYGQAKPSKKVIYPYRYNGYDTRLISLEELQDSFPKTYAYLNEKSEKLKARKDSRNTFGDRAGWYGLVRFGQVQTFKKEKIVTPGEVKHNKFCIDNTQSGFTGARVFAITMETQEVDIKYLLGVLNSKVVEFFMHHTASLKAGGYYSYSTSALEKIPVVISHVSELSSIVSEVIDNTNSGDNTYALEEKIDSLVYDIYGLNEDDIATIEEDLKDIES